MLGLFEPSYRRNRDEREIRYYFTKYGDDAPAVLSDRSDREGLSSRDRRHWRRLARKARRARKTWLAALENTGS